MDERTAGQPRRKTAAEYKAAIDRCLEEIRQRREQMARDQVEIDRLRDETRAILSDLKAA